jgi:hypothetical protein
LYGFVACRIAGTSIGFSHGFTLRGGVLGYSGVGRREEGKRHEWLKSTVGDRIRLSQVDIGVRMDTKDHGAARFVHWFVAVNGELHRRY